ncbi:MAG TPA: GntR family transcriptional regulator [Galbitalea sp.]|nr:GntR family transcriptional regulator [Galbitalea sp.]
MSVTSALRKDILNDVFPAGSRLVEVVLSERYKVSRAAVRAALLELSSEGLVVREANRGATVRRISVEEAVEITEARGALEGLIAAYAARNVTESESAGLLEGLARMRVAVEDEDIIEYGQLNVNLHLLLRQAARHSVAADLVDNLKNRAVHHQFRLSMLPGRLAESLAQHEAIVAAVITHDESAATDAMVAHLNSVASVLRRWAEVPPRH